MDPSFMRYVILFRYFYFERGISFLKFLWMDASPKAVSLFFKF